MILAFRGEDDRLGAIVFLLSSDKRPSFHLGIGPKVGNFHSQAALLEFLERLFHYPSTTQSCGGVFART